VNTESAPDECFGAKHFPDDEPSYGWGLIDLEQYAQAQHAVIVRGETTLAPTYWRLGRSLELIRRQRGRGAWGKYLESLHIHRVRACKARAICRHFSTAESVAGLAVEEAYKESKSKPTRGAPRTRGDRPGADRSDVREETEDHDVAQPAREKGVEEIAAFLSEVHARAGELIDAAAFAELEERTKLFPAYRSALEQLQFLGRMLGVEDEPRTGNESLKARGRRAAHRSRVVQNFAKTPAANVENKEV